MSISTVIAQIDRKKLALALASTPVQYSQYSFNPVLVCLAAVLVQMAASFGACVYASHHINVFHRSSSSIVELLFCFIVVVLLLHRHGYSMRPNTPYPSEAVQLQPAAYINKTNSHLLRPGARKRCSHSWVVRGIRNLLSVSGRGMPAAMGCLLQMPE